MDKKLLVGGAVVVVAIAAAFAWNSKSKDAPVAGTGTTTTTTASTSTSTTTQAPVVNTAKSDAILASYKSFLADTKQADKHTWESVTTLADGTPRLNNVKLTDGDDAIDIKSMDLHDVVYTPEKYNYDISFDGVSVGGKSPIQLALEEEGDEYQALFKDKNLPLMGGRVTAAYDVAANKSSGRVFIDQPEVISFEIGLAAEQVKALFDLMSDPANIAQVDENPMSAMAALAPLQVSALNIKLEDKGVLAFARQQPDFPKMSADECKMFAEMMGVPLHASICENLTAFLNGDQSTINVKINPSGPYPVANLFELMDPKPETIEKVLKELDIQASK